jgi:hypothetical protein
VLDSYHASARLGARAEALFGAGAAAGAGARKMEKLLLKPARQYRVLHAAAALRSRVGRRGRRRAAFRKA